MHKLTRISYNSARWQKPTGDAREYEAKGTYNHKFGFGHEDWLFRSEWLIDGWRYAFIQGVNKSRVKLVKAGQVIDLTLFTIQPDKKRRIVADIGAVECLDVHQSKDALEEFRRRGWYDAMRQEIQAVGGDDSALGAAQFASDILNVRFRQENVSHYTPNQYIPSGDPLFKLSRYMLYDFAQGVPSIKGALPVGRLGSSSLPRTISFLRGGTSTVECTPEHARMQAKLMKELTIEYPEASIRREKYFIDVTVETAKELIIFEIKSDLEPKTVIRQALGQILEYAYHPSRQHALYPRLVIVGRTPLSAADEKYLCRLKQDFGLPLEYRVVSV